MKPRPNFIIIYSDDLGFGDLNCYGASGIPTPNLDRLAEEGLRFTNTYATAATCTPSRYSLLTGKYPWRNPQAAILTGDAAMILAKDEATLPRTLQQSGYRTGLVGKWHLGLGDGNLDWNGEISPGPLEVGFDHCYMMAATNDRVPCVYVRDHRVENLDPDDPLDVHYGLENPYSDVPTGRHNPDLLKHRHSDSQHWDTIVNGVGRIGFSKGGTSAQWTDETMSDIFVEKAKEFVTENKDQPFFLYYALHQPHCPRIPGPRFVGATDKGPRGDVIAELDDGVGQLMNHLNDLGLSENTVVIFSSDNGPVLDDGYEDDAVEKCGEHFPAGPLRGGKYSLFDGGTRVPMVVWGPGRISVGESAALLSHVDFYATLVSMAGEKVPEEGPEDSRSLPEVLTGEDGVGRDSLVTEGMGPKTVVRQGSWVFIPPYKGESFMPEKGMETGCSTEPQLYDLSQDIGQRTNVAAQHPERVKELFALLSKVHGKTPRANSALPF